MKCGESVVNGMSRTIRTTLSLICGCRWGGAAVPWFDGGGPAMVQATTPAATTLGPLPDALRRVLGRLDRRLRAASAMRGLGVALLVAALGAALGMAADFAWVLPQPVRWAIWGAWLAA